MYQQIPVNSTHCKGLDIVYAIDQDRTMVLSARYCLSLPLTNIDLAWNAGAYLSAGMGGCYLSAACAKGWVLSIMEPPKSLLNACSSFL